MQDHVTATAVDTELVQTCGYMAPVCPTKSLIFHFNLNFNFIISHVSSSAPLVWCLILTFWLKMLRNITVIKNTLKQGLLLEGFNEFWRPQLLQLFPDKGIYNVNYYILSSKCFPNFSVLSLSVWVRGSSW